MADRRALLAETPGLRRYARALLHDPIAADDLVQDTLERALSRWRQWRAGGNLRAWLFSIMHSQFIDQMRRRARRPEDGARTGVADERLATPPAQEDGLKVRDLEKALERLTPEQREVVLLIGLEDLSYKEAGEVLGVPVGTVMSRLSRGRENLRRFMNDGDIRTLRRVK
mgnify:CR=1 FL=1